MKKSQRRKKTGKWLKLKLCQKLQRKIRFRKKRKLLNRHLKMLNLVLKKKMKILNKILINGQKLMLRAKISNLKMEI
jgi:hypothetical protein